VSNDVVFGFHLIFDSTLCKWGTKNERMLDEKEERNAAAFLFENKHVNETHVLFAVKRYS